MTRYAVKTAPSVLAVTIAELKSSLQIEHTEKDLLLTDLLKTAIDYCETKLGWYMATRTMEMYRDSIPSDGLMYVTRGPVSSSGISVAYVASGAKTYTELSPDDYQLDNAERIARIHFYEIPGYSTEVLNPIKVSYTAGYEDLTLIPEKVKRAVILVASYLYLNPENKGLNYGGGRVFTAADDLLAHEVNDHTDD